MGIVRRKERRLIDTKYQYDVCVVAQETCMQSSKKSYVLRIIFSFGFYPLTIYMFDKGASLQNIS